MSIREQIEWDGNKMHGFVDMGSNISIDDDNLVHAKNALVFMAVGANGHWKMPIGYFLIGGLNGSERGNLLNKCLQLMANTGAKVHSITFDGAYSNATMCKYLGATFDKNKEGENNFSIKNPFTNEPMYIFYDPCHMLKLVRNTLGDLKCIYDGNGRLIKWDHIIQLFQKEKSEGLRAATKLSNRHINYYNEKMNVKLAAQVLSNSVSCALRFCQSLGDEQFSGIDGTAVFCSMINNAFDILNCRSKYSKSPFNVALDEKSYNKYKQFGIEFENYIYSLRFEDGKTVVDSGRKTGFIGLVKAINNLLKLYSYIHEQYSIEYLLSYKLSQDHLETFFSSVRQKGGFNNNPTSKQFQTAYKKLLIHNEINGSQYGNCIAILDSTQMSVVTVGPDNIVGNESDQEKVNTIMHDHDYFEALKRLTPYIDDVSSYISGFVVKKLLKKINCKTCHPYFMDKTGHASSLIKEKDRNNALIKPSQDVVDLCQVTERVFRSHNIFLPNVKQKIVTEIKRNIYSKPVFKELNEHCTGQELFNTHRDQVIALIITTYLNIRFHHAAMTKEKKRQETMRKKYTKMILWRNE